MSVSRSAKIALFIILGGGALLRLINLTGPDMVADDAHYALRAVEYVDYAGSTNTQTTPWVWFAQHQWWQGFSFHDAPPLVFAVEWFFFQLFGDNLFAARIPFVLAGLAAIFGMFLLARELTKKEWVGIIAAALVAVSNYHIWLSRIGLLDGFVVLFVMYALYFFIRAEMNQRWYLAWGACCAGGLLSKYTFLFMGVVFLIPLLTVRRSAWRSRWLWYGIGLAVVLIMPIIIYNIMMYKTRGHFDAALSTMIGMHPEDFKGLTRSVSTSWFSPWVVAEAMAGKMSMGISAVFVASLALGTRALVKAKNTFGIVLLWSGLIAGTFMLTRAGASAHYNIVLLPLLILLSASGAYWLWERWHARVVRNAFIVLAAGLIVWEGLFAIQSQLVPTPVFAQKLLVEQTPPRWEGYNAIETYVKQFYTAHPDPSYVVYAKSPQIFNRQKAQLEKIVSRPNPPPQQTHLLVYDDRMDWTPMAWIVERRRIYDVALLPAFSNFLDVIEEWGVQPFLTYGFTEVTFMVATDAIPHNKAIDFERVGKAVAILEGAHDKGEEIRNSKGDVIVRTYHMTLKEAEKILRAK